MKSMTDNTRYPNSVKLQVIRIEDYIIIQQAGNIH